MNTGSGLEPHRLLTSESAFVAFRSILEGNSDAAVAAEVAAYFDEVPSLTVADVVALRNALGASRLFRCAVLDAEVSAQGVSNKAGAPNMESQSSRPAAKESAAQSSALLSL
jgi:hypothetical protein